MKKLRDKVEDGENLTLSDLQTLNEYVSTSSQHAKTPFWKALCWIKIFCCAKDRHLRRQEAINERFEEGLDIRKLVETATSLNLLMQIFLKKPAKLLFNHHRDRIVRIKKIKDHDESSNSDDKTEEFVKILTGFQPMSENERNLLLGVFPESGEACSDKRGHEQPSLDGTRVEDYTIEQPINAMQYR